MNRNGMMKAIQPKRTAVQPVFIGSVCASEAAA